MVSNYTNRLNRKIDQSNIADSSVKTIESKGIDLYQSYYYASIYLEAESVPDTFETNWYYNSYTSSTGYISCYTGQNIDY